MSNSVGHLILGLKSDCHGGPWAPVSLCWYTVEHMQGMVVWWWENSTSEVVPICRCEYEVVSHNAIWGGVRSAPQAHFHHMYNVTPFYFLNNHYKSRGGWETQYIQLWHLSTLDTLTTTPIHVHHNSVPHINTHTHTTHHSQHSFQFSFATLDG